MLIVFQKKEKYAQSSNQFIQSKLNKLNFKKYPQHYVTAKVEKINFLNLIELNSKIYI